MNLKNDVAPATGSPSFHLNQQDLSFLKFVLFHAFVGALLYVITAVYGHFNYGVYAPFVAPIFGFVSAFLTQLLNSK